MPPTEPPAPPYRTHVSSGLSPALDGEDVALAGWCHVLRRHGGVLFLDLRDHAGLTQCVVEPDSPAYATLAALRPETVVRVAGTLRRRPAGMENLRIASGGVELAVASAEVLGAVHGELPLPVAGEPDYPEEARLRHRYLDLRRPEGPRANLLLRARVLSWLRRAMEAGGFVEFQTPILTASSPEGARDFLVPSRLQPGKFYALPQAPQQFKQLLMISGFDRYYQVAPCFRDEAARADRSPGEFYQLDVEMAFVGQEDVFGAIEPVLRGLFEAFGGGLPVTPAFPRIPYREAMLRYGTDKPDLRNPLEIRDAGPATACADMTLDALKDGAARMVRVPAAALAGRPRSWFEGIQAWALGQGAAGLGYLRVAAGTATGAGTGTDGPRWSGPLARHFGPEASRTILEAWGGEAPLAEGDAVFVAAGEPEATVRFAGLLRTRLAEELGLVETDRFAFCWVVDFPMFERDPETGRVGFSHNPFSMPQGGLAALEAGDPLDVLAYQYDVVCNGVELSSGAIRNHDPAVMERAFAVAGYGRDALEARFGGMLRALRCGAPPHGGIAPGIDRMVMLLAGAGNLREVVAFPMNQRGEDLMMGAPAPATPEQLAELGIRSVPGR